MFQKYFLYGLAAGLALIMVIRPAAARTGLSA